MDYSTLTVLYHQPNKLSTSISIPLSRKMQRCFQEAVITRVPLECTKEFRRVVDKTLGKGAWKNTQFPDVESIRVSQSEILDFLMIAMQNEDLSLAEEIVSAQEAYYNGDLQKRAYIIADSLDFTEYTDAHDGDL